MIELTGKPISPEQVIRRTKTDGSGCVVTYVGVIRDTSHNKKVASVEYQDRDGRAVDRLRRIADDARKQWQLEGVAFTHRTGKLKVGDINLVIAVAAGHRQEGFAACQYIIDRFKQALPTHKIETYTDGTTLVGGDQSRL